MGFCCLHSDCLKQQNRDQYNFERWESIRVYNKKQRVAWRHALQNPIRETANIQRLLRWVCTSSHCLDVCLKLTAYRKPHGFLSFQSDLCWVSQPLHWCQWGFKLYNLRSPWWRAVWILLACPTKRTTRRNNVNKALFWRGRPSDWARVARSFSIRSRLFPNVERDSQHRWAYRDSCPSVPTKRG